MSMQDSFLHLQSWQGTSEDLTVVVAREISRLKLDVSAPSVRTVRLWRSKRLLTRSGAGLALRQVLEALGATILLKRGWTHAAISELLPACSDSELESRIVAEATGGTVSWVGSSSSPPATTKGPVRKYSDDAADDAAVLLAQGLLRLYERVLTGRFVVRQDDSVPAELHQAMCRIGRLYIEEGTEDKAACVHDVCERAREPLGSDAWGLVCFAAETFRFRSAVLVDPVLRVPTADCSSIAESTGSFGEDHVIEHRLHGVLRDASERLGPRRRDTAYTAMRELLGRHSLVTEQRVVAYLQEYSLTSLQETVTEQFYESVPETWLIRGRAHRCRHCGSLMRPHADERAFPDGRCPVRPCRYEFAPMLGETLDPAVGRLLVARPQVLTYWTGPALDELSIFDAARKLGLDAELYPESDICDVGIDGRAVGIDAKSYTSPVSLALRLNRGIGGLARFDRRIVAVSDYLQREHSNYLAIVRSLLDLAAVPTLELATVSQVRGLLGSFAHA